MPAAIALAVLLCFAPAVRSDFITWDDQLNFIENVHYRGLSPTHLGWMFTTFHLGHYQPLSWITLGLDYRLWGMDATGYHLTNVLLHTANAVLFYWVTLELLRLALGSPSRPVAETPALSAAAAAGALFFAIHPLRVESVAWVSERRDVLSAFFYLATVLTYLQMCATPRASPVRWRWRAASLACLGLSLLSKAWGMTLPAVLLALDVYPLRRLATGDTRLALLVEKIPYAVLAAVAAGLAAAAQSQGAEMLPIETHGLPARLAQAVYGLCFYLAKTLLPIGLSPVYVLDPHLDPAAPAYLACAAVVVVITIVAIATWKRWPWLLVSWSCYAIIVSPVLGLVQTGPQIAADRYAYLSCLPWAVLAAAGLHRLFRGRAWLTALAALAGIGLLAGLTVQQVSVWHDSMSLWNHALRLDPNNVVALFSRGVTHESGGDLDRAYADYSAAIQKNPGYADAYFGRGNVHRARGDLQGALADFSMMVRLRPHDPRGYVNRGVVAELRGDLDRAAGDYTAAIERDATCADAYFGRANVRRTWRDLDSALADYTTVVRLRPQDARGYLNRGLTYESKGDLDGALADYTTAIENGGSAEAYLGRANVRQARGEMDSALADYDRVVTLQPQDPRGYANRAAVRRARGELNGAAADYRRALELAPPDWGFYAMVAANLAETAQQMHDERPQP